MNEKTKIAISSFSLFSSLLAEGRTPDEIYAALETNPSFPKFLLVLNSKIPKNQITYQNFGLMKQILTEADQS